MKLSSDMMTHWTAVYTQRGAIYRWFESLLAQELTAESLAVYATGQLKSLFELLSQLGLKQEAERLSVAVARWHGLDLNALRIDLMADFTTLFLLDNRRSSMPYASYYLESDQQLYGDATARMQALLQTHQLKLQEGFKEPADHLAVFMAVLAAWCEQVKDLVTPSERLQMVQAQVDFIENGLLSWLPLWYEQVMSVQGVEDDFYPALCALLVAYVQADAQMLMASCVMDDGHDVVSGH